MAKVQREPPEDMRIERAGHGQGAFFAATAIFARFGVRHHTAAGLVVTLMELGRPRHPRRTLTPVDYRDRVMRVFTKR